MSYTLRFIIRQLSQFKKCSKIIYFNNAFNVPKINFLYNYNQKSVYLRKIPPILLCSSILTWLGFSKEDETKESELIMTLKRSVLSIQRKEYVKAEQLLHLALRLAQEQSNPEGVLYVYDLMANLAMERNQLEKAEKLFVNVLQKLLSSGLQQEDMKVIHISLKMARIQQMKKDYEKAELGFVWCLETIKKHLNVDNKEALLLNALIKDWYANFLLDRGRYEDCLIHLEDAYRIFTEIEGKNNEKTMVLLNDLATANWHVGNLDNAQKQLTEALSIVNKINDVENFGFLYANLGMIKLQQGFVKEAKKYCKEAWRVGKKQNDNDTMDQAKYCFDEINKLKS